MTIIEQSYSSKALILRWSILAFALFLVGTNGFVIAGVLPEISSELHVGSTDVGYTITLYAIVVAILAPAVAVAAPRVSRTTLMIAGLAAFVIGVVIAALAPDLVVFGIGRVIAALGGAALVPTATAAGASITPPARRGQAIAVVGIGFTLASAVGAPIGTAIAAASDWRVPMYGIAGLGVVTMIVLGLVVRRVPLGEPLSFGRRFAVLRDGRILMPLITTLLLVAGFNIVYIFSSEVTGFGGTTLAILLLIYGVMGIVGNALAGPLTDRFGSRRVGTAFMIVEAVALAGVAVAGTSFAGLAVAFFVWGISAFAAIVPIQHRLLGVDGKTATVAISWFSTAMYVGIAAAPVLGAAALATGIQPLVPIIGSALTVLGLASFVIGYRLRRGAQAEQTPADEEAVVEEAEEAAPLSF
jgi:DHA1 family inner membrane transport protein